MENNPQCIHCHHKECFINCYCSAEWKKIIGEKKTFGTYKAGQYVFREGNFATGVYFIYRGTIKIFNTGKDDRQNIIGILVSGDLMGLRGFSEKNHSLNAYTIEDSFLCFLDKELYTGALRNNPELAISVIQYYSKRMSFMEMRHKNLVHLNCKERTAEAILVLCKKFGKNTGNGILIDISLSRQDIGSFASVAIEQVSRIFSQFQDEKYIKVDGKNIIVLDKNGLVNMVVQNCCGREEYFANHNCMEYLQ